MIVNRKNLNIQLYQLMLLIRRAEEAIINEYDKNDMKTPMHMSMGSEAIAVGVVSALKEVGEFYGTYRSHALYLALSAETDKFLGEMYGKESGVLKGKGGSMHLISPDNNLLGVSAIVGSTIPLAVGTAYANVYKNKSKIAVVFFGDGAIDEGVFWESLNTACLMKLPVIFVCEDNGYAVHTAAGKRHGYKSITEIVSQFNCSTLSVDSTDPEVIFNIAKKAQEIIKNNRTPVFLHLTYYRYLEHVGILDDFNAGYRSKEEFDIWYKKDPILLQRKKLIDLQVTEGEIKKIEDSIDLQIIKSLEKTKNAQFPQKEELYKFIFSN